MLVAGLSRAGKVPKALNFEEPGQTRSTKALQPIDYVESLHHGGSAVASSSKTQP